jgi:signal transduction histidine kinase
MCSAAIDRALAERASTLPVDQYLLDTPADLVRLSLAVRAVLERAAMHVRAARLERERDDAELLCSALAHDLREPLWAIRELAAALIEDEEGRLDESGEAYCRRLLESADRMQTLIHDLLAYYRLGRDDAPAEPVAIPGAIEEARRLLPNALRRSGGVIVSGDCLPVVIGHRTALVRVIANILGNAVKFVAPGVRPEVKIWAEPRDGLVRVWIEDNGIGISPDARQRIFEPLIRLHGQDRYAGTGIGLAYARRAVARMGGGIGVEPRVGGGSRFWIDLPNAALETSG